MRPRRHRRRAYPSRLIELLPLFSVAAKLRGGTSSPGHQLRHQGEMSVATTWLTMTVVEKR